MPFDVNVHEHKVSYFVISIIHSLSPVVVFLALGAIVMRFPKISDKWNIKKEFTVVLALFFFTGIAQFLLRDVIYLNPDNWSWRYLSEEIINTCIAGTFVALVIIPFNYNRLQLRNQDRATQISGTLAEHKVVQETTIIPITTEQKSEDFTLNLSDFLYAESEGNYVDLHFVKDGQPLKLIKRMALKRLESQLTHCKYIIRTHRSVILNLKAVDKVSGNAQGYKVRLKGTPHTVPVSRGYISIFEIALTNL